jgi:ribosome-associated protein
MASTETRGMVLAAAAAGANKKAEDTRILELDASDAGFTDFFLIMSGTNARQVVAIADEIELRLKQEFGTYPNSVEGRRLGEWVLMDYVDFVVHIFVAEKRAYYDIERLRKSATSMDVDQLKLALTRKVKAARKKSTVGKPPKKAAGAKRVPVKKRVAEKVTAGDTNVLVKKKDATRKAVAVRKAVRKTAKKNRRIEQSKDRAVNTVTSAGFKRAPF